MKSLCCSTKLHRHFANRFATKPFKGAVVTTKPRRRRRGRGAAAIKTKMGGWAGKEPDLDGRVPATANSEAGEGPLRRTRGMVLTTKNT